MNLGLFVFPLILSMLTGTLATLVVMATLLGFGTPSCDSAGSGTTPASSIDCSR